MKRSGLKYFFGHWLTTNHEYIAMLFFFFARNNHIQSFFIWALQRLAQEYRYLQSTKGRMWVKRKWRKSRVIILGKKNILLNFIF